MKLLLYAAKIYDQKSFDMVKDKFPEIEIDYIDHELEPRTAGIAKGYDAIFRLLSSGVMAKYRKKLFAQFRVTPIV